MNDFRHGALAAVLVALVFGIGFMCGVESVVSDCKFLGAFKFFGVKYSCAKVSA